MYSTNDFPRSQGFRSRGCHRLFHCDSKNDIRGLMNALGTSNQSRLDFFRQVSGLAKRPPSIVRQANMGRGQGQNEYSTGTSVVHHRSGPDHQNAIDVLTHVGALIS